MTTHNPLVRINGKIVELPAPDVIGGAPAGNNGTDGIDGGAITIRYTFDTTTTDADPGAGKLRLDNATQDSATKIYADLTDALGSDWTTVLDTFDDSTNTTKGSIRLVKSGDAATFLAFNVTALTSAAGYRKITVSNTASSASSPFANGDTILLCFDRAGDKGADGAGSGLVQLAQTVTSSSASTVDFQSISGSYSALKVLWFARDTASGTSFNNLRLKINNDGTSGNYTSTARIGTSNGAAFATSTASSAKGVSVGIQPNDGNTAGVVASGEITLVGYAGTTFHKRVFAVNGSEDASNVNLVMSVTARWASTSAINRLTFSTDGTAFKDGSTFTLYGLS